MCGGRATAYPGAISLAKGVQRMSAEENKATVMRFDEEVWNRRNPAAIDALVTSDYVLYAPGSPPLDREGHKQFTAAMLAAFSDARSTTHDLVAEGDPALAPRPFLGFWPPQERGRGRRVFPLTPGRPPPRRTPAAARNPG